MLFQGQKSMHFYKQPRRIQYLFLGLIVCIFICKIPTLFYVLYWSDYFTGVFCVNLLFCFVLFCLFLQNVYHLQFPLTRKTPRNALSHKGIVLFSVFYFERTTRFQCFAGPGIKVQHIPVSSPTLYKDSSIKKWDSYPTENSFFLKNFEIKSGVKICSHLKSLLGSNEGSTQASAYIQSHCLIHLNFKFPRDTIAALLRKKKRPFNFLQGRITVLKVLKILYYSMIFQKKILLSNIIDVLRMEYSRVSP